MCAIGKLSKDKRREQLLDVAMTIVREDGADELTLGTLAAKAGVSRPVAYDHFSTRAGLLLALFQRLESKYLQALQDALRSEPREIRVVADVMSKAYFNCLDDLGPEALAISAALKGSAEMATQEQAMIDDYVELMCQALHPLSPLGTEELRLTCIGLLGAAEAIARERHDGRISNATAIHAFSSLVSKSIVG
jgi:AcrR family transcriptional regulator